MVNSSRAGRLLLTTAALLAVLAALITAQTLRLKPVVQVRQVRAPAVVAVDAAGCPVTLTCQAGSSAPPRLLAAIERALPGAKVQFVNGVYQPGTGKPYRLTVAAQLGSKVSLILIAQRLPGTRGNDPESFDGSGRTHTDLAGNAITDSRTLHAVVPGKPGCSIELTLTSVGPDSTFDQAALRLARDPDVQLSP